MLSSLLLSYFFNFRHSMLVPRVCEPWVTRCSLGKYWSRDWFRGNFSLTQGLWNQQAGNPGVRRLSMTHSGVRQRNLMMHALCPLPAGLDIKHCPVVPDKWYWPPDKYFCSVTVPADQWNYQTHNTSGDHGSSSKSILEENWVWSTGNLDSSEPGAGWWPTSHSGYEHLGTYSPAVLLSF